VSSLIILVALFVLLWVLLIRPQRQRQQQQQNLLSSIEAGDEVLTVGGLYGIVREIDEDDDLIVEIAEGIRVRIARRAVGGVVKPEDEDEPEDDDGVVDGADEDADGAAAEQDEEPSAANDGEPIGTENDEGDIVSSEESVSDDPAGGTDAAERR
jgi:preprotein translocase subunit YajC